LIVNKFGGYIDFISKYRKGSTFFYTFSTEPHFKKQHNEIPKVVAKMTVDLSKLQIMGNSEDKNKKFKIPEKNPTQ
jgi:hypothetical protein